MNCTNHTSKKDAFEFCTTYTLHPKYYLRSLVASLLRLYDALFEGLLRYTKQVVLEMPPTFLKSLESVQDQVIPVCLGLPKPASTIGTQTGGILFSCLYPENRRNCKQPITSSEPQLVRRHKLLNY